MNQDLVVAYEHNMTPTAQLADFILPGDMWAERDVLGMPFDLRPVVVTSQAFAKPAGLSKDWYFVVKGLADRLGFADRFPWQDCHALYDYRLKGLGVTWEQAQEQPVLRGETRSAGRFLTPSGKVELKSSILEALGYDPLPSYTEHAEAGIDEAEYAQR
jgi:anaerobic selenocysteine-containing dehydrogenase